MKKLILILGILLFSCFVYAQETPDAPDVKTISIIQQEHKNTRKFFSDELTRQQKVFFDQVDDRANYYEDTANNIVTTASWKLGLLWSGIMLGFISFSNFLRTRLEKRKYDKFKANIKEELMKELKIEKKEEKPEPIKEIPKQTFIYDNKFEVEL